MGFFNSILVLMRRLFHFELEKKKQKNEKKNLIKRGKREEFSV